MNGEIPLLQVPATVWKSAISAAFSADEDQRLESLLDDDMIAKPDDAAWLHSPSTDIDSWHHAGPEYEHDGAFDGGHDAPYEGSATTHWAHDEVLNLPDSDD